MTIVDVLDVEGGRTGSVELPPAVFDAQANVALMHQVVVAQLAAARQGTHKTKTRGEVSGGGRKPYKQKGTGRARQGSIRAPQFTGGGVVHGPVPRDYAQRTPKKMKAAALRGALSDRAREGRIHLVQTFVAGDTPRTKDALATLRVVFDAVGEGRTANPDTARVLAVLGRSDETSWLSLRNVPTVHLIAADQLNTYDVLVSDEVVFTATGLNEFLGLELVEVVEQEAKAQESAATDPEAEFNDAAGYAVDDEPAAAKPARKSRAKAAAKSDADAAETKDAAVEDAADEEAEK